MANYWFPWNSGDIDNDKICLLTEDKGPEAFYLFMKILDKSISSNGEIKLDRRSLSIVLKMNRTKELERFNDYLDYMLSIGLLSYEENVFRVPLVRERIGDEETRALNKYSDDEKGLVFESIIELTKAGYIRDEDLKDKISNALVSMLRIKMYGARELLKAVKIFCSDFQNPTEKEKIIDDKVNYLWDSLIEILRAPEVSQENVASSTFLDMLIKADYIQDENNQNELDHYLKQFERLKDSGYTSLQILKATEKFLESLSFKDMSEIKSRAAYIYKPLEKILKGTVKKEDEE